MAASGIKTEAVREVPGRHVVYGPYEHNYGHQHYGWVEKEGRSWRGLGVDGRAEGGKVDVGLRPTIAAAAELVGEWARQNLTGEALSKEFENRTAGGWPISFLRRTARSVVAVVREPDGRSMQTSWGEDGACSVYEGWPKGSEENAKFEALRLVRKEPAPEPETEDAPAPGQ